MTPNITAIYVVEENEALREVLVYVLEAEWADTKEIRAFGSSAELLAFVREQAIVGTLVIHDVITPWDGGLELYDELRDRIPELKFLFITTYSLSAAETASLEREGFSLLEKPFSLSRFIATVKKLLE